ncbi:zf-TFIIB domain-containing protein [Euryarchaeota archaeon]|nr:zf-TFIIB domain-containing protein [Euryarchaeota archaeon]
MRKCPKCKDQALGEYWTQSQMIDRCANCGGQYYDHQELDSIIEMVRIIQKIEIDEPDIETLEELSRSNYKCPVDEQEMERKDYGGIAVDSCPKCKGVWLDKGEIVALKATEDHIRNNMKLYINLASGPEEK